MSATATILWDQQTEESNETFLVEELVASNSSSKDEEFYATERHFEAHNVHSLSIPSTSTLPLGTAIDIEPRQRLRGDTNPITLVYGSEESYTESETVALKMPDTVAPNTKVTVKVTRQETYTTAPVEITLGDTKETAIYMCQSYSDIKAETNTESL
ncbi:epidermal differentiation-specific protein-like [Discoglossus pictus]